VTYYMRIALDDFLPRPRGAGGLGEAFGPQRPLSEAMAETTEHLARYSADTALCRTTQSSSGGTEPDTGERA
jgi:hypothetical protein